MTEPQITIAGRAIGAGHPPYVVAELSANHRGDIEVAFALIAAAKRAGADAVKIQTYTADTITIDHDGPGFRIEGGLWHGRTLYDLYRALAMPTSFFVDPDGVISIVGHGLISLDQMRTAVDGALDDA